MWRFLPIDLCAIARARDLTSRVTILCTLCSSVILYLDISRILALISHPIASNKVLTWLGEPCDFSCQTLGVNFTNLCVPKKKMPPTFCFDEIWPICMVKFAKLICHLPNAVCPKKAYHLVCAKKPREYVGEIDPRCQFHQRFLHAFFV